MKGSERKLKHTKEQILNALHVIKDECSEHERCNECVFSRNDDCLLDKCPDEWNINDENVSVWKGLL